MLHSSQLCKAPRAQIFSSTVHPSAAITLEQEAGHMGLTRAGLTTTLSSHPASNRIALGATCARSCALYSLCTTQCTVCSVKCVLLHCTLCSTKPRASIPSPPGFLCFTSGQICFSSGGARKLEKPETGAWPDGQTG